MKKLIPFVALLFIGCTSLSIEQRYERAKVKCAAKCSPQTVLSVGYNYANNRYDRCICSNTLEKGIDIDPANLDSEK